MLFQLLSTPFRDWFVGHCADLPHEYHGRADAQRGLLPLSKDFIVSKYDRNAAISVFAAKLGHHIRFTTLHFSEERADRNCRIVVGFRAL
jgi:hypothetical protein